MILAVVAAVAACGTGDLVDVSGSPVSLGPIDLTRPWESVSPSGVGVDPVLLDAAVLQAGSIPRFGSLLAVKDGRVFLEEYFVGTQRDLRDVRSVTKSIVSSLVAVAIAQGYMELDDTAGEHLPAGAGPLSAAESEIQVRDLLTMTAGFEWDESRGLGDYNRWIQSEDHIQTLLDREVIFPHGTRFTYNSAAVHLLSVLVTEAVGEPLPDFARRVLFNPIGVGPEAWEPLRGGDVNGGSGIDLRTRDLARIGQLYLQDGMSGNKRVLPAGWVTSATAPAFPWRLSFGALDSYTYGYLWWASDGEIEPAYLAWGWGGQFIYVVPHLRLVVVATTEWIGVTNDEGGSGALERQVLDVLVEGVHRAVRGF